MLACGSLLRKFPKAERLILGASLGTVILMTSASAGAMPIIFFGDSLSDTGNVSILSGGAVPSPAFYFEGRYSNGPILLDQLGAALGSAVDPSLDGGGNFAFAGARVAISPFVPSLRVQANTFLDATAATGADPGSLYFVYGGANDIPDAIGSADPIAAVTSAAQQLAGIVQDLADAGAVDIVVPTLINVGHAPQARQAGDTAVALAGQLSTAFNQTLTQELAGLNASSEVNLIRPDFFALLESITASPSSFGLTNVTDACLSATPFSVTACADPDQYLFWDQQHPTTAGHALFANLALDAITAALDPVTVPEPWPAALMAPLLLAGLISLSRRKTYP
jgi:outer membrane lipase/esterase